MTFFEWIRSGLRQDANALPFPRIGRKDRKKQAQNRPNGDPGPDRRPVPQK
ncbi:MAG: hypothetical protein II873_11185 [Oscillospiraceae bacterium]|nr:hypothetical protein [Oscillospiraceae bacterium]